MIVKQLSVFLQNEAGRILELTDVLGKAKVNIEALSVAETGEYGMVRMIASDIEKASSALKNAGFSVNITDVLRVVFPDTPGALCKALTDLKNAGINVSYMYGYSHSDGTAPVIMKVNDIQKACAVLK